MRQHEEFDHLAEAASVQSHEAESSEDQDEEDPEGKKKKRVKRACVYCNRSHISCENGKKIDRKNKASSEVTVRNLYNAKTKL
jgi:hypothetical protein